MSNELGQCDPDVIGRLRVMAREGRSPCEMVQELKRRFGMETHVLTLLTYFKQAFSLTLAETKPLAALSRNAHREITDELLLDDLLLPAIEIHRSEWDACEK